MWGALAFGAVYSWAYWPLAATCILFGTAGVVGTRQVDLAATSRAFAAALLTVFGAIVAQLVPLPVGTVALVSPHTIELLRELNPAFAAGSIANHTLSVWPRDSSTGLVLYGALALLCVGMTRLFSAWGCRRFVEGLTAFAVVLALVGIVQRSSSAEAIYGIWKLEPGRFPFGPFVNRNHYAGWMVMALPLTLALLIAGIDRGMRGVKQGWRHRVLWFSSAEASQLILIAAAAVVMALSLVMTMSRSGITAFALSVAMTGWFAVRTVRSRTRRVVAAACLGLLFVLVLAWTGPTLVANRFATADWGEFNNRKGAWLDAWSVVRDFPLTGTGLNTYWAPALFYQRHELDYFFGQAHNDYLQLAAEGGLMLIVPALACVVFLVRDIRAAMIGQEEPTTRWLRLGAVTALVAIGFQETVEFSLQMPGNAALFAVVCAIALHRPGFVTTERKRWAAATRFAVSAFDSRPLQETG
ncbi:MAG TPA: O-antigen ligase family protein [Vicinamibacterales bacterium]|nr:O-antigen ligase family protein [Vicinamibacterales bacterium]